MLRGVTRGHMSAKALDYELIFLQNEVHVFAFVAGEGRSLKPLFLEVGLASLDHFKVGGSWQFKRGELENWIEEAINRRGVKS